MIAEGRSRQREQTKRHGRVSYKETGSLRMVDGGGGDPRLLHWQGREI